MLGLDSTVLGLAEYRVTRPLRESGRSRLYEAVAESDGRHVIAKVFDISDSTVEARVRHEFELIRALDFDGVVRAESLQRVGDQLVLILQRVPGVDLHQFADGKPLPLPLFWRISTQVADILAQTHAKRIIHRDIKPANLLFDVNAGRAYVADFGISVLLESERRHIYDEDVVLGTLPYISPEQTGRTNRSVDFRSDLYSLGVTFYELLTGSRPFEGLTPIELIHAHLARAPRPPAELCPALPEGLSRLVMKLLAKAPEHRYQTAAGLAADLRGLEQHREQASAADYELGREDRATGLQLPHQLYGRAREQAELRDELEALIASRERRVTLLAGPQGVGKSALLDMLAIVTIGHGGYVLRGTIDPYRERPYAAFDSAFTGVFEQLLTESDSRLERWRSRLLEGLGALVGVVCGLVPTLSLIVGPQPPAPELGPIEARNRLQVAMDRLVATLCEDCPVVLMLDDLHHADHGSVMLLESLSRGVVGPLLVVGTLREDEVADDHPLRALLDKFGGPALPRARLVAIEPLGVDAIEGLLQDALGAPAPAQQTHTLAAIITRKTGGVPLFVRQLLSDLIERELVCIDANGWRWDRAEVEAAQIPDDAVAMMSAKLDGLPVDARRLIGRAACLGARFGLADLARVSGATPGESVASSFELIEAGLLVAVGQEYRFPHNSIQVAAQKRLAPHERRSVHWNIGRHLLETVDDVDEHLFDIVEHLGAGAPRDLDPALSLEIAALDLRAGQRALASAAYDLALRYLEHGLELLGEPDARKPDELRFGLGFGRAQALALANHRETANDAFDQLLAQPLEDHQFGRVVARRIRLLQLDNRQPEAVALGREALARLGAPIPRQVSLGRALVCLTRAWLLTRKLDLDAVMAIPACQDPRSEALVEIVAQLKYPAFVADFNLFMYLSGLHVRMLREHGFHETTPVALADLSINVSGGFKQPEDADRILNLALDLCPRLVKPEAARCNIAAIAGALGWHRNHAFSSFLHEFDLRYPEALELGEFDHAAFLGSFALDIQLETGTHLAVLDRRAREVELENGRRGAKQMEILAWISSCCCAELLGPRAVETEESELPRGIAALTTEAIAARGGVLTNDYGAFTNIALVQLLLGDRAEAVATCMRGAPKVAQVLFNSWLVARMYTVTCVAVYMQRLLGHSLPPGAETMAHKCLPLLQDWAKTCPDNYGHYVDLVLGAREAARGRLARATPHLDRAWGRARARGCRWVEGLAAELTALVVEAQANSVLVDGAWQRVWDAFSAWGADAKLQRLRAAKPKLFGEPERRRGPSTTTGPATPTGSSSTTPSTSQSLDLESVLRSVGVITEDLQLEEVVTRVLDAALTNVGADHGLLLLERGGELSVVADAQGPDALARVLPQPIRLRDVGDRAPSTVIHFVIRTGTSLVLDDAGGDSRFASDPYCSRHEVRSLLAMPIVRNALLGVIVLENRLSTHAFRPASIETLRMITSQAASTLDNARLYAALGRSEARWRSLVDGAPDVIALLDERGELVFANHGYEGTGGTRSFSAAMSESSRARWDEAVERVLGEGQQLELELELDDLASDDGVSSRWFAVRIAPIDLEDDELTRDPDPEHESSHRRNAVAVATDITDRKRAEAEHELLETQLRQQQRLESLGTLASGVAHEINNPVQGILNYAELIASNPADLDTVREFSGEIIHETERVANIVRNLLAFSRQEHAAAFEDADVAELIQGTISLLNAVLRKDHIKLDLDLPSCRVRCRVQQIQQVIMNLVTNARDALNEHYPGYHERKRITISGSTTESGAVRITVHDTAGGIPEDVIPRIFDPFFTTKGRDQGTGLGLSVSHGIMQEHGGELSVESRLGDGTSFHIDLPSMTSMTPT